MCDKADTKSKLDISMVMLSKTIILHCELLHSWFSCVRLCPNLNDNSMSQLKQFKERRGYHGIKRIKTFENEKENQYQGRRARFQLPVKVALDIDFIDEQ